MQWIFFRDAFGDWHWERLDGRRELIAEARLPFESRADAEADAAAHGYLANTPAGRMNAAAATADATA